MELAPCLCIPVEDERRTFRVLATMIDTSDVTGATLAHSDSGRGADFVPMMSAAHSDDAPIADNIDRESMSKDVEE